MSTISPILLLLIDDKIVFVLIAEKYVKECFCKNETNVVKNKGKTAYVITLDLKKRQDQCDLSIVDFNKNIQTIVILLHLSCLK